MVRNFSNRIFGGVCGGLGSITPINAWIWRILFILLTILTFGAGALVYILLWWMLPLNSPIEQQHGGAIRGLIAVLLSIGLIAGWFLRGSLPEGFYWPAAILVLALNFFFKQLAAGRRGNIALAIVGIIVPLVFLLGVFDILQGGLYDLALRSWPAVLIFYGLWGILRHRMPFGGFIALLISAVLVAGVAFFAFSSRTGQLLDDQQIDIAEAMSETITTLQINVSTLDTDVRFSVGTEARQISGNFSGSNNSDVQISYDEDGAVATFTLAEQINNDFPLLEDIGRSTLTLALPPELAVAVAFRGEHGAMQFDMASLNLERLNFDISQSIGEVVVTLPQYQPLSPSVRDNPGVWTVVEGDLRVLVPETLGTRFLLDRSRNQEPRSGENGYDELIYRVELDANDYVLVTRQYEALEIGVQYRIDLFGGSLDIDMIAAP